MVVSFAEDFDGLTPGAQINSTNTVFSVGAGTEPYVTTEPGSNAACGAAVPDNESSAGQMIHWNGPPDFTSGTDLIQAACRFRLNVDDPDWYASSVGVPSSPVPVISVGDFGVFAFYVNLTAVRQVDDTFLFDMGFVSTGDGLGYAPFSFGGVVGILADEWFSLNVFWSGTDIGVTLIRESDDEHLVDTVMGAAPRAQIVLYTGARFGATEDPGHWNVYVDSCAWSYESSTVAPVIATESATRLYPRNDGLGVSSRRLYPPPRSGRLVGGYR